MRTLLLLAASTLSALSWSDAVAQPRLVVVIVVDQMRASYLEEFGASFDGGFARLRERGAVFLSANHDHALTETAPGNVTVVTGTHPSRHGVVGNEIWDRQAAQLMGAVLDPDRTMVGAVRRSGRSPWRMLRSTLGDWLKASSPESRVFGVSLKDRTAVFLAGHTADGAYWYDERAGNFVTSDYYRDALPDWVAEFNAAGTVDAYFRANWSPLAGLAPHASDRNLHRGSADDYPPFPHLIVGDADEPDRRFYARFRLTPFADLLTLDFAEALIEAEQLGVDGAPDLAFIGLSASDYIGHRYGPTSNEIRDHYARLDGYLGGFFNHLDEQIGPDEYVVVLTADHGVSTIPERIAAQGGAGARIHEDDILAEIEPVVADAHRRGLIESMPTLRYEFGVIFDFGEADVSQAQSDSLAALVAAELSGHPFVSATFTHQQLREGIDAGSPWFGLYERSFHPDRAPDVVAHVRENHLITDRRLGTSHSSPYAYDRHVPLIFTGPGISAGEHAEAVRTVDVAPTIAALLGIAPPSDIDGKVLTLGPHQAD